MAEIKAAGSVIRGRSKNKTLSRRARRQGRAPGMRAVGGYHNLVKHPEVGPLIATAIKENKEAGGSLASWIWAEKKRGIDTNLLATMMQAFRRILNDSKTEYRFRLVLVPGSTLTVTSNVIAANMTLSPLAASEWSGIIDALFDEYRVDEFVGHYQPMTYQGTTSSYNRGFYAVGTDYDLVSMGTPPASLDQVFSLSDAALPKVFGQNASGYFTWELPRHTHISRPPQFVGVTGSVASVDWIQTAQAWPGAQQLYCEVAAADASGLITRAFEWFVRCRMRR